MLPQYHFPSDNFLLLFLNPPLYGKLSLGKKKTFQVTDETCNILKNFGYTFEQRGLVAVKGKGQLMTHYLIGKGSPVPQIIGTAAMEPLKEEDETLITPTTTFPSNIQQQQGTTETRLLDDVENG